MNTLSEYDVRQIRLIKKIINLFENQKIGLFDLIGGLSGLLNALESVDDFWKDDFQVEVNTLEMVHDSIEDGSISKWRENPQETVQVSILKLKEMTTLLLEKYLRLSDPNILEVAILADSNWVICSKCNDAWESNSTNAMVICPKCECLLHNPLWHV
jgi:hypothetical protein